MGPGPQMFDIRLQREGSWRGREFRIHADLNAPGALMGHLLTAMWQIDQAGEDQIRRYSLEVTPVDSPRDKFEFIAPSNGG